MAFQACLETHCIGELGDDDDDNGDNKFLIYGSALGLAGKVGDQKVSVVFRKGPKKWKTCKTLDNYDDKMCSDDDDKLALVRRGVSHIWCAPGGQMNIAGHI